MAKKAPKKTTAKRGVKKQDLTLDTCDLRFEGASRGNGLSSWLPDGAAATISVARDLTDLRNRSRDLVDNDSHANRISRVRAREVVSNGFRPTFKSGSENVDAFLLTLWEDHKDSLYVGNAKLSFDAYCRLVLKSVCDSGEVFLRVVARNVGQYDLAVPYQIQVLEADFVDHNFEGMSTRPGFEKNVIRSGVEFDEFGMVAGYWVWLRHPGENGYYSTFAASGSNMRLGLERIFVPADEMCHVFRVDRPGQVRGTPWLSPVVVGLRTNTDLRIAHKTQQIVQSSLCGVVTKCENIEKAQSSVGDSAVVDAYGKVQSSFSPGHFLYTEGESVEFPSVVQNATYADSMRSNERFVASGAELPYELMTGDFSQANFSQSKLGMIEFTKTTSEDQDMMMSMFLNKVAAWHVKYSRFVIPALRGIRKVRVKWSWPKVTIVDRNKEASADALEIENKLISWEDAVQARGEDPQAIIDSNKAWAEKARQAGVKIPGLHDPGEDSRVALNEAEAAAAEAQAEATANGQVA